MKSIIRSPLRSEFEVKMCEIAICVILHVKLKPFPDRSFTFHLAILLNEHSIPKRSVNSLQRCPNMVIENLILDRSNIRSLPRSSPN